MAPHRPSLQRHFLSGLITLLPLWLTVIVFRCVFVLLSDISRPWITPLLARLANQFPLTLGWLGAPWVQTALALIATLAVIIGVGVMAHRVLGQRLLRWFEAGIQRVPLANLVYGAVRKLIDILQTQPEGAQRVVLIDFPHRDMKVIGFVTRVLREEGSERELAAVYVPTTPNPTSGYLEVVPVESLTPTDWSVDQAMSFIISGGAVSPETIPFTRSADRNATTMPDEAAATADGNTPPAA
ncbi:MAG: DUF502 domain-containing protein [Gammaproteobacteria bacterium]|nr:DUF502 domain-containing protein [Gammaproteobacteria bacterium]